MFNEHRRGAATGLWTIFLLVVHIYVVGEFGMKYTLQAFGYAYWDISRLKLLEVRLISRAF